MRRQPRRSFALLAALLGAAVFPSSPEARAAAGALDHGFGTNGRVTTPFGVAAHPTAVVVQPDGKLVVAGVANGDFAVARYLPNGTPDETFGGDGIVTTNFQGSGASQSYDEARAVAIQLDERNVARIVVAGTAGGVWDGDEDPGLFALARYAPDGSLDQTFGAEGKVVTDPQPLPIDEEGVPGAINTRQTAHALGVLADGRLIVAGAADDVRSVYSDLGLVRYTRDGAIDTTFGTDGKVTLDLGSNEYAAGLAIQTDGKYVVVGEGKREHRTSAFLLARYTDRGALDPTFGEGGTVLTSFGGTTDKAHSVTMAGNDKIVVAGRGNGGVAVARYTPSGQLDSSWSGDGKQTWGSGTGYAVVANGDNVLVAGGVTVPNQGPHAVVLRFSNSGELDSDFGTGGAVLRRFNEVALQQVVQALTTDADGRAVVAGHGDSNGFVIERYLLTGEFIPRPPRIVAVVRDDTSPASGIDTTPAIDVANLTFGYVVKIFDGTTLVGSKVATAETVTLNAEDGGTDAVVHGDGPHTLTAVVVDTAGRVSPPSLPFSYVLKETQTDLQPQIDAVDPSGGPTAGGTTLHIRGKGLASRSAVVEFGGVRAASIRVHSDTELTATTPPRGTQGAVEVTVTTANGRSAVSPGARFTFGAGAWTEAPALTSCDDADRCRGRYLHTTTVLPGDDILVVGGTMDFFNGAVIEPDGSVFAFNSAQRLSRHNGTWSWVPQPDMAQARFMHTATLLNPPGCVDGTVRAGYPCGHVLVAGGQTTSAGATASVEMYEPDTGTWESEKPDLITPRFSHTATLLADGRVLFVGGIVHEPRRDLPVNSVELYDPATGSSVPGPPLVPLRASHTATTLTDGTILVAGGLSGPDPVNGGAETLASAAVYDPRANAWRDTSPLAVGRYDHTATLMEGPACARSASPCGKVLVAGGNDASRPVDSGELYDPVTRTWSSINSFLDTPRSGHTATLLRSGGVLLVGGGPLFPATRDKPLRSASLFDPAASRFSATSAMGEPRAGHTASLLPDGTVLAIGGFEAFSNDPLGTDVSDTVEIYRPAPSVASVKPAVGQAAAPVTVTVTGTGFSSATGMSVVRFGPGGAVETVLAADAWALASDGGLTATLPALAPGPVSVAVVGSGGTSATDPPQIAHRFVAKGRPATPSVAAIPVSDGAIRIDFPAVDDGGGISPATRYVVKQSLLPIDGEAAFEAAAPLCDGGFCSFTPPSSGTPLRLDVTNLEADTTYHYAVRALSDVGLAGGFATAHATTAGSDAAGARCPAVGAPLPRQVAYAGGVYSLVGLPGGTMIDANSPLYGWVDQGARGGYSVMGSNQPVEAGRGYWAWFACPRLVSLNGTGEPAVSLPLGAYHASMVGNPSGTSPASVTGHDFAARWDPALNGGAGGYHVSGYREAQTLAVGEGAWAFTYGATRVAVTVLTP